MGRGPRGPSPPNSRWVTRSTHCARRREYRNESPALPPRSCRAGHQEKPDHLPELKPLALLTWITGVTKKELEIRYDLSAKAAHQRVCRTLTEAKANNARARERQKGKPPATDAQVSRDVPRQPSPHARQPRGASIGRTLLAEPQTSADSSARPCYQAVAPQSTSVAPLQMAVVPKSHSWKRLGRMPVWAPTRRACLCHLLSTATA